MQTTSYKFHLGLVAIVALSAIAFFSFAATARAEDGASGDVHIQVQTHSEDGTTTIESETETHGSMPSATHGDSGKSEDGNNGNNGDAGAGVTGTSTSHGQEMSGERNKGEQGEAMSQEHAGRIDFDRDSEEMQASSTVSDPKEVKNENDLRDFTAGIFEHNDHVTHIDVSTTSVGAEFDAPARLFGIFPVNVPARVDVSHDGSVDVSYPWYAIFFTTHKDAIEQAVASSTSNVTVGESVSLSAGQQATLVHSIMAALQNVFGFSGSASATSTVQ